MVYCGELNQEVKLAEEENSAEMVRTSISFSKDDYAMIQEVAKRKKVSLAWVVRDAVERYLEDETPIITKIAQDKRESLRKA